MNGFEIVILIAAAIAGVLLLVRFKQSYQQALERSRRRYVWLEVGGATKAEGTEETYRGAYHLLVENVRMELRIAGLQPLSYKDSMPFGSRGGDQILQPRIKERAIYTTESLQPHLREIQSFEDFQRHTTYTEAWVTVMRLSVHPDDAEKAVRVLERAGMTVERPTGRYFWH